MSVQRIKNDLHPKETRPVRCVKCGYLIIALPCRICKARQELRPGLSTTTEPGHLSFDAFGIDDTFGIDLHGKEEERYLKIRRKVHAEIMSGTRTPGQYAKASPGIYD